MDMKIGVFICECGPNIADNVDIDTIIKTIPALEEFEGVDMVVKPYKLLCSNEGQQFLEDEIQSNKLTHLVVAACSPRDHESTFMNICKKTALNPYLFKMVNIREQCAWIIPDKKEATEKAIRYIRAGIRRTLYQSELLEKELESNPDVLIIGGGIAGIQTALMIASEKRKVFLVEKQDALGGKSAHYFQLLPGSGVGVDDIHMKIQEVQQNEHIQIFTNTHLESIVGFFGNFEVQLKDEHEGNPIEMKVGAIVVATGFSLCNAQELKNYHYKKENDVYTSLEIEEKLSQQGEVLLKSGKKPQSVALIHCVGRDEKGYCSKICCNYMLKIAQSLKDRVTGIEITEFYRDLCVPNKLDQDYYEQTREKGVDFIRFKDIALKGTRIEFVGMDDVKKEVAVDMVILAPAMIPAEETQDLAEKLNIPLHESGFFQEAHPVLNPVTTTTDGIFIVGTAQGPTGVSESLLQAQAAGGSILTQLIPGEKFVPEVKVSEILEDFCTGCQTCLDVCCYGAIYFDEQKAVSVVNEAVCRGCGNCAAACPSGAIRPKHFTNPQLYQEVMEAIR